MAQFRVQLDIPSTTYVGLIVEADNKTQARERALDYEGDSSEFVTETKVWHNSSDQEYGERRVGSISEIFPKDKDVNVPNQPPVT